MWQIKASGLFNPLEQSAYAAAGSRRKAAKWPCLRYQNHGGGKRGGRRKSCETRRSVDVTDIGAAVPHQRRGVAPADNRNDREWPGSRNIAASL